MSVNREDLLNGAVLDLQYRVRNLQGALANRDRDLQAAQAARDALVAFHDEYEGPDYHVRPALARILLAWDRSTGRTSPIPPLDPLERPR